jgi:hypothetical protein
VYISLPFPTTATSLDYHIRQNFKFLSVVAMDPELEELPVDEIVELFMTKLFEYCNESKMFVANVGLRCNVKFDSVHYKCRSKDDYLQKCSHLGKLFPRFCHRVSDGVPVSYFRYTPIKRYSWSDLSRESGNDLPFTIVLICATSAAKQKWGVLSCNYAIDHGILAPVDDNCHHYMLNSHDILQQFVQYHSSDLEECISTDSIDNRDIVSSYVNLRCAKATCKKNGNLGNFVNSNIYAYSMDLVAAYFKDHGDANPPTADIFAPPKHDSIYCYR